MVPLESRLPYRVYASQANRRNPLSAERSHGNFADSELRTDILKLQTSYRVAWGQRAIVHCQSLHSPSVFPASFSRRSWDLSGSHALVMSQQCTLVLSGLWEPIPGLSLSPAQGSEPSTRALPVCWLAVGGFLFSGCITWSQSPGSFWLLY